jgi:NADH dehydrogenase
MPLDIDRDDMRKPSRVLVTGASGFVGSHVIDGLLAAGRVARGLSRKMPSPARKRPGVEYFDGVDIGDSSTLTDAMFEGTCAIVHLIGIIQEAGKGQTFQRIHVDGTLNVIAKAKSAGFEGRFIYMSAIGSEPNAPSEYSRSKYAAEQIVTQSGLPYTIFRPSIILGKDGEFVEQMSDLVLRGGLPIKIPFPVIPVPGAGRNKFQPVYVDDLVKCVVTSLNDISTAGNIFEIGGASQVSFNELISGFAKSLKTRKPMVHAPIPFLRIAAGIMEKIMSKPPVTRDQLANLGRDNIAESRAITDVFGVNPLAFDDILRRIYE